MTRQRNSYSTAPIRQPRNNNDAVYPCADCGVLRSANNGAKVFTVCDKCWDLNRQSERKL